MPHACVVQYRHGIVSYRIVVPDVVKVIVDGCVWRAGSMFIARFCQHRKISVVVALVVLIGGCRRNRGGGCLACSLDLTIQCDVRALDEKTKDGLAFAPL